MKLLLDACVWPGMTAELTADGHDVIWIGNWPTAPADDEVLAFAAKENRVVVTLDKDFGELAVVFGHPHSGIIRIVDFQVSKHASVCLSAIKRYSKELAAGAIVTAEPGRLRIRPGQSDSIFPE
jgi:predicted nuclease of predicted toxin-antitoxin system